jgi:hypothetical protein
MSVVQVSPAPQQNKTTKQPLSTKMKTHTLLALVASLAMPLAAMADSQHMTRTIEAGIAAKKAAFTMPVDHWTPAVKAQFEEAQPIIAETWTIAKVVHETPVISFSSAVIAKLGHAPVARNSEHYVSTCWRPVLKLGSDYGNHNQPHALEGASLGVTSSVAAARYHLGII